MGVFDMAALRDKMVLPHSHHHSHQSAQHLILTTARRFWIPILALLLTIAFLLHATPEGSLSRLQGVTTKANFADPGRATLRHQQAPDQIDWDTVSNPLPVTATIEERLQAWEDSPEIEPADWVRKSAEVSLVVGRIEPTLWLAPPRPQSIQS